MRVLNAIQITSEDLIKAEDGFSWGNVKEEVRREEPYSPVVFFNGRLVKNRYGNIQDEPAKSGCCCCRAAS